MNVNTMGHTLWAASAQRAYLPPAAAVISMGYVSGASTAALLWASHPSAGAFMHFHRFLQGTSTGKETGAKTLAPLLQGEAGSDCLAWWGASWPSARGRCPSASILIMPLSLVAVLCLSHSILIVCERNTLFLQ